jgi:hypothetical protein
MKKTVCVENTDEWGNSHDYIVVGDDIAIEVKESWRRVPWTSYKITIVTNDLRVIGFSRDVYSPESFCGERKIDEDYIKFILFEDLGYARRFWVNLCKALDVQQYRDGRYEIEVKVHDKDVAEFIKREICAKLR